MKYQDFRRESFLIMLDWYIDNCEKPSEKDKRSIFWNRSVIIFGAKRCRNFVKSRIAFEDPEESMELFATKMDDYACRAKTMGLSQMYSTIRDVALDMIVYCVGGEEAWNLHESNEQSYIYS